jgi:hypothetical protein
MKHALDYCPHPGNLRRISPRITLLGVVENQVRYIQAKKVVKQALHPASQERVDLESPEKASRPREDIVIYKQSGLREGRV